MKNLILMLFLAVTLNAVAQKIIPPIDSVTHKITYQGVLKTNGDKDALYDKGLNWMATSFKSSNDVIQIKDKANGKIVGRWVIQPLDIRMGFVDATITLLFKDGRFKYIITDLYYEGTTEFKPWALEDDPGAWKSSMTKGAQHKIKDSAYAQIESAVLNLKKYMSTNIRDSNF